MAIQQGSNRAECPADSATTRAFRRNAADSLTSWMQSELGAESTARSTPSPPGRPPTASPEELSARAAAVDTDRLRIARRLTDDVIREMFAVGLRLQATAQLADSTVRVRLEVAVGELDLIIAEVRSVIFDCSSRMQPSCDDWTSNLCSNVLPLGVEFDSSAGDGGTAWTREVTGT